MASTWDRGGDQKIKLRFAPGWRDYCREVVGLDEMMIQWYNGTAMFPDMRDLHYSDVMILLSVEYCWLAGQW